MMSMTLIVAGGIIAFLLVYFGTSINNKEHFALQLLSYSFAMILIIIVAKGAIDSTEVCELVPVHEYSTEFHHYQGATQFSGLTLGVSVPHFLKLNHSYTFMIAVYDENGKKKTNASTDCVYGSKGPLGDRYFIDNASMAYGYDYIWNATLPASFLNETGVYSYQLFCDDVNNGGFFLGSAHVTASGLAEVNESGYIQECHTVTPSTSAVVLYRFVLGFFVLYLMYLVIYTFWWIIKRFAERHRKK